MEIIKHGKNFRIACCSKCECEFQFATKEIKRHIINHADDGFYIDIDYVECPECGERVLLENRSIEL